MYPRVQGLDPPAEALGKAGQLLDRGHRYAELREARRGRPGRDDLDPGRHERARQLVQPGLVVHADQRAPDGPPPVASALKSLTHRPTLTFLPSTVQPSRARRPTYSTSWRRSASLMRSVRLSSVSPSSTGTATCAMIGPVSTPASTKCRV